jgi:hypothetical protein
MTKVKTGAVILLIGRQHSGKTPIIKRLAKQSGFSNKVVYDRQKEYDVKEWTTFYSVANFKEFIYEAKNCFIVCEEATGFINSFKDMEFTDLLISIEHNNNILVCVFHSLMDAPTYILRLARFMVLLNTNDDPKVVERQRPKFFPYLNNKKDVFLDLNNL